MTDTAPSPSGDHRPPTTALDPLGPDYAIAFAALLAHTEPGAGATEHLAATVAALPRRRVLIDAGAGTGRLTARAGRSFDRVIAIEPSPHLRPQLTRTCSRARVLAEPIADAVPGEAADLVLCSRVLYHVPTGRWDATLDRLAAWTAPGGEIVLVLQNPDGDCARMLHHFTGHRYDLSSLIAPFTAGDTGHEWTLTLTTVPGAVETPDLDTALTIARFLLNDAPLPTPPHSDALAHYLHTRHRTPTGRYRLTCPQDYLHLRRARP